MSAVPADRGVGQLPLFGVEAGFSPPAPAEAGAYTFDVHAISIPARAFTGDFYVMRRQADRLWFALGDVAGKGLNAAVIMAMIQEELESMTRRDPAVAMQRLHAFLRPLIPRNRFATAVIGYLSDDGTLVMANAGHCSPLIARANGTVEEIASTGPVVGALPGSSWRSFETALAAGETLVLYSDGVTESRSPDGHDFGVRRLAAAFSAKAAPRRRTPKKISNGSARQIAENLVAAVNVYTGGIREDDLTLIVVRR